MRDVKDKTALFTEQLPKWEGFIYARAAELLSTRVIDRGLYGVEDIQQTLRIALWQAIEKYDESKHCSLDTWITKLLKQKCSLLVENQYRAVPREVDGTPLYPEALYYKTETGEVEREFEDVAAEARFNALIEKDWFKGFLRAVKPMLKQRKGYHEEQIWRLLLTGKYNTSQEIADELGINFAKVGSFRLKLKLIYCMLNDIPVEKATNVKNRDVLFKRLKRSFKPFTQNAGLLVQHTERRIQ